MKFKTLVFRIVVGLILIVLGILAITRSEGFVRILVILCGLYMVCYSLFGIFTGSVYKPLFDISRSAKALNIVSNVVGVVFGLFAIIAPIVWAQSVGVVLAYVIAAYLLFSCFVSLRIYFGLKKAKAEIIPKNLVIEALCDLVFALVLILAPQAVAKTILIVLGVVMIVTGALVIILTVAYKIRERKAHASSSEFQPLN